MTSGDLKIDVIENLAHSFWPGRGLSAPLKVSKTKQRSEKPQTVLIDRQEDIFDTRHFDVRSTLRSTEVVKSKKWRNTKFLGKCVLSQNILPTGRRLGCFANMSLEMTYL